MIVGNQNPMPIRLRPMTTRFRSAFDTVRYDFESVSKDEYRQFVQRVQGDCLAAGLQWRFVAERGETGSLRKADFDVYCYDGLGDGWNTLAIEYNPMQADWRGSINNWLWTIICASMVMS